jgi:menaquinone-dependent protoporphyrinogen IX oxidase
MQVLFLYTTWHGSVPAAARTVADFLGAEAVMYDIERDSIPDDIQEIFDCIIFGTSVHDDRIPDSMKALLSEALRSESLLTDSQPSANSHSADSHSADSHSADSHSADSHSAARFPESLPSAGTRIPWAPLIGFYILSVKGPERTTAVIERDIPAEVRKKFDVLGMFGGRLQSDKLSFFERRILRQISISESQIKTLDEIKIRKFAAAVESSYLNSPAKKRPGKIPGQAPVSKAKRRATVPPTT